MNIGIADDKCLNFSLASNPISMVSCDEFACPTKEVSTKEIARSRATSPEFVDRSQA